MGFWDELSSSTGAPTGTSIVEDPFARAVRIYQMELANAEATAQARRNPAPNFGMDELTGTPFQLPQQDASMPGPATGRRAFGDTEADIQQEIVAPFEQFGDALMDPFQRSGRRGTERRVERREAAPRAPVVHGSATSGYFTVDPITGETREVRAPIAAPTKPDYTKAQEATIRNKYIDMKSDLSKTALTRDKAAMSTAVQEMEKAYPWLIESVTTEFKPSFGDLRLSESQGSQASQGPRRMVWDSKQRKLVPAK